MAFGFPRELTAMSGLSASTYSCGGEAGRFFFGGGEAALAMQAPFLKYLSRVPLPTDSTISSSPESIDGAEEREDMSDADMLGTLK